MEEVDIMIMIVTKMVTKMMTLRTVPRMLRLKSVAAKTPPAVMLSMLRYSVKYILLKPDCLKKGFL